MHRKQSHKKICCLFVAVSILVALVTSGCVTHRHHIGHGEHRVTRSVHPAAVAGIAVGLLTLGTVGWLVTRDGQQPKEQTSQTQEPEKTQNQK